MDIHPIDENSDILRQSRVIVSVNVSDINDNAPYFIGLPYLAIVQIDARPGTSVKQVILYFITSLLLIINSKNIF